MAKLEVKKTWVDDAGKEHPDEKTARKADRRLKLLDIIILCNLRNDKGGLMNLSSMPEPEALLLLWNFGEKFKETFTTKRTRKPKEKTTVEVPQAPGAPADPRAVGGA